MTKGWYGDRHKHMMASKGVKVADWKKSKRDYFTGDLELSGVEIVNFGDDLDIEENYKIVSNKETLNDPYINEFYDIFEQAIKNEGLTVEFFNTETAPNYSGYKTDGYFDSYDFIILMVDYDGYRLNEILTKKLKENGINNVFLEMISDYSIGVRVESKPESKRKKYKKEGKTMSDRITNLRDVLGNVPYGSSNAKQGIHYKELASSLWADEYLPTVIEWNHGAVDDFTDRDKSFENYKKALEFKGGN